MHIVEENSCTVLTDALNCECPVSGLESIKGTTCVPARVKSEWEQVSSYHESETCFMYNSTKDEEPTVTELKTCPWCNEVPTTFSERTGNSLSWCLDHDCPSGLLITISHLACREYVVQMWNMRAGQ